MIRPKERIEKSVKFIFWKQEKPWQPLSHKKTHYGFLTVCFVQLWLVKSCDFLNFSPFTPMGKTIKNHTAAVWLVMVFKWLNTVGCEAEKSVNFLDICGFQKTSRPRKNPWFSRPIFLLHCLKKLRVYAGFSGSLNRVWKRFFAEYLRPPPFFTTHTWKRLRPLVVKPASAFALTGGDQRQPPFSRYRFCKLTTEWWQCVLSLRPRVPQCRLPRGTVPRCFSCAALL